VILTHVAHFSNTCSTQFRGTTLNAVGVTTQKFALPSC